MITHVTLSRTVTTTPPKSAAAHLDEAITHAETSAFHLQKANSSTQESTQALDGYQPAAVDVSRDTPYRDVSASARSLHARADATSAAANSASGSQYSALSTLDWAIAALDQALQTLPAHERAEALEARRELSQGDALWHADVALGTALATINGGALPYIEAAEGDAPGQDVSWTGGEIHGNLRDGLGQIEQARHINGGSLNFVSSAVSTLRALRERVAGEEQPA